MSVLDITDTTRAYRSRCGDKIVVQETVMKDAFGANTIYPVRATVIKANRRGDRKSRLQMFTQFGRANVNGRHGDDVVGLWGERT